MIRYAVVCLTLLCAACRRSDPPPASDSRAEATATGIVAIAPDSPRLRELGLTTVELKPFPVAEVVAPGKLEVNPNLVSRVLLPVSGRVRKVLVGLGDAVEEGQPLLLLESHEVAEVLAEWRQAQAQLNQARAAVVKAEKDLERARDLYEHRAAPLKDVLAAERELADARAAIEQAEATLAGARHRLDLLGVDPARPQTEIAVRAPISGRVTEISVAPGEFRSDTGTPVMMIADLRTLWVSSQVPESQIRLIEVGERLEIELTAFPGEVFEGRVRRIADMVDPQSRTVKVHAELDNRRGRLRPEMFGTIRHTHGWRSLPAVPATAIIRAGEQTWVYVERGPGRFERLPVELGETRNGMVAVLSGLQAGDRVVSRGAALLSGF